MKTLQDLFDTLATGEFANIAIGQSTTASITEAAYPKMVAHINLGLRELYKRFVLSKREIRLYQQPDVTTYILQPEYVEEPGFMDSEHYIESDPYTPFTGDIVRILEAYDEMGRPVHINNPKFPEDIFMMAVDRLKLAKPRPGRTLRTVSLIYQAYHPKIEITETFDPTKVSLEYPDFIEQALLNFIASRLFKGKTSKGSEGVQQPYNTFGYQYEKDCQAIQVLGLDLTGESDYLYNHNFDEKGWC